MQILEKKVTLSKDTFYDFISNLFEEVGTIEAYNEKSFFSVFHSENAQNANVVYIWMWNKDVNRLKGNSKILYIGKTDKTIAKRYSKALLKKYDLETTNNRDKYEHIFDNGSMTVLQLSLNDIDDTFSIPKCEAMEDKLRFLEGFLLRMYFKNHLEFPPFNYTKSTVKSNELTLAFK